MNLDQQPARAPYRDWQTLVAPPAPKRRIALPSLKLDRTERQAIHTAFDREEARNATVPNLDELSNRDLIQLASSIRTRISAAFGNLMSTRNHSIQETNIDPSTHLRRNGAVWDRDAVIWYSKADRIQHEAVKQLAQINETLVQKQNKLVTLYQPDGTAFDAKVTEMETLGLLGSFVRVQTANDTYTLSIEQFQKMQQKPTLYGPKADTIEAVTEYISYTFADSPLKLCSIQNTGTSYKISYRTPEGRKFAVQCKVKASKRHANTPLELEIHSVTDYQSLVTASDYQVFIGDNLTRARVQSLQGKSNFLHSLETGNRNPAQPSFWEKVVAKGKSWLF